ncbi:hypothetical protein KZO11_37555 [Streptomyces anulatus]|uniref:hypothetical protein n=1 Tax=Streptomyces anulatus TaxID=1892 RepID=UPI001C5D3EE2|nr:hypothetical protein [Streptomyces anulatus]QYA99611.1 hypothetical protein KZO11_37555 [Streptomyces anulatus]
MMFVGLGLSAACAVGAVLAAVSLVAMIAENWFTYDVAGALEQVGAPPATGP